VSFAVLAWSIAGLSSSRPPLDRVAYGVCVVVFRPLEACRSINRVFRRQQCKTGRRQVIRPRRTIVTFERPPSRIAVRTRTGKICLGIFSCRRRLL